MMMLTDRLLHCYVENVSVFPLLCLAYNHQCVLTYLFKLALRTPNNTGNFFISPNSSRSKHQKVQAVTNGFGNGFYHSQAVKNLKHTAAKV